MAGTDSLLGEVQRRLIHLGLPDDVRHSAMAMVRSGLVDRKNAGEAGFGVRVAQTFYRTSQRAARVLGSPSTSMMAMLLDLFVAAEQDRAISVSSLCIASGAAPTTALRLIGQLEANGFVTRIEDQHDRRRSWVRPTQRGLELVRSLVEEWAAVLCA